MAVSGASNVGKAVRMVAMAACCVLAGSCWAAEQKLSIVTEEWAPYNYSEDGAIKGFSVEIVRAMAQALNADIDIRMLPTMRAKASLEGNKRTMLITMLRTPERETKYKWIGPLGDSSIYFYKRKGDPLAVATLEDTKNVRAICTRQGAFTTSRLQAAGFTNLETGASDGNAVYKMLIFGRCDLAVSDSPLGVVHLLKQMNYPLDAVVQTPVKLIASPIYIACSKDISDTEIARWQAALDKLKSSGVFQAIQKKYSE
jgi:polar amino acid transport system substrate-binding protein